MGDGRILNDIDGEEVGPAAGRFLEDVEPATGKAYAQVPDSDEKDVEAAVEAARRAFPGWAGAPAEERCRLLLAIADRIEVLREELARAESIDAGKPIALARSLDIP